MSSRMTFTELLAEYFVLKLRIENVEARLEVMQFNGGGGSAGNAEVEGGDGGSEASIAFRTLGISRYARTAGHLLAGQPTLSDVSFLTRQSGILSTIGAAAPGLAAAMPYAAIALALAPIVERQVRQLWNELHEAEIEAEEIRNRASEREKFKAWTG